MIRISVVITKPVQVDVRSDNDGEATKLASSVLTEKYPGQSVDVISFETLDDDESIPAGAARLVE